MSTKEALMYQVAIRGNFIPVAAAPTHCRLLAAPLLAAAESALPKAYARVLDWRDGLSQQAVRAGAELATRLRGVTFYSGDTGHSD